MSGAHRGQKKELDLLEQKCETAGSCHVHAGHQTLLLKEQWVPVTTEPSLHPEIFLFLNVLWG